MNSHRYTAEITVRENLAEIEKLFASEEREFANERAKYTLEKGRGCLVFKAEAKDTGALRAVLNSIAKLLATFEKTKEAVEDE
ncbi:hypothetical protein JW711_01160 [Candidatus Woesearchaeota archaeon]|nr:hypothetical protein [Candidatus Woesearchaeota archaeon]